MKKMNQNEIIELLTESTSIEKDPSQLNLLQMLNEANKMSFFDRGIALARKALPNTMNLVDSTKDVIDTVRGIPQSQRTRVGSGSGSMATQPSTPPNASRMPTQSELGVMMSALQRSNFRIAPNTSARYAGKSQTGRPLYAFETLNGNQTIIKVLQPDGKIVQ
jgi:uncharacterized protein YihD (DUF1040 family)